ncbi:type I secretion system permease/ATPase [Aestuariibacter sp. AA17]|uniref:Type I secretion system permease/ATPase n=1 Tax=Fluctibacter corallii TaxID=2984329 RepID=A0ABT3A7E9_9ALTE|nr:type I secretion system permease/ATPase [Aestuariibacter sp. AA17]MCV2884533.1 type I secretion system permease/ATPase [Aestuariibacter sp. AA17]
MECLVSLCHYHGREVSPKSVLSGLPLSKEGLTPATFSRAAKRVGLSTRIVRRQLEEINTALLPAILILKNNTACVVSAINQQRNQAVVIYPELHDSLVDVDLDDLGASYTGEVIFARPEFKFENRAYNIAKQREGHWFWSVLSECKTLYRDVLAGSIFVNLFSLAMPLYIMNVYDRVVPNEATDTLWVLSVGIICVLIFELILRLLRAYFLELAASRADVKISSTLMEKALGIVMTNKPSSVGAFVQNIQSFEAIRGFMSSFTLIALVDFPFLLLFIGIISFIYWPLVLPIVVGALIVIFYALSCQHAMRDLSEQSMEIASQKNGLLVESITNLEDVKTFAAESKFQNKWEHAAIFTTKINSKLKLLASSVANVSMWVQQSVGVVIVIIGVYAIGEGDLTQGGLIAAYLISSRAMAPIGQSVGLLSQFHHASTALSGLNKFMASEDDFSESKTRINLPNPKGKIEFKHVHFSYPNAHKNVLRNFSLNINPGEKVAILGANGSGKSTINRLVIGHYHADKGAVLVDDINIQQLEPSELKHAIGYVPQDINLFSGTLKDNINLGVWHDEDEQLINAINLCQLTELISSNPEGVSMQVGEKGSLLSGGQRQLVALARALISEPQILLLDEPTASLDHKTEQAILKNLKKFSYGRTVILVTHRAAMLDLVDRVILLGDECIVADGPKHDVLKKMNRRGEPR